MAAEFGDVPHENTGPQEPIGPTGPGGGSLGGKDVGGVPQLPGDLGGSVARPGVGGPTEHAPQITRIVEGARLLMDQSMDHDRHEFSYQTPYGPDHTLALQTMDSTNPLDKPNKYRRVSLDKSDAKGLQFTSGSVYLERTTPEHLEGGFFIDALVPSPKGVADDVAAFGEDLAVMTHDSFRTPRVLEAVNRQYDEFIAQGDSRYTQWVWHMPNSGNHFYVMTDTIENQQPWTKDVIEPQLRIRVRIPGGGRTDLNKLRDDTYETSATAASRAAEERAIHGSEFTMNGEDGKILVFDLGEYNANRAVVAETERAMGLRQVQKPHLDVIERGMEEAIRARGL